MRLLSARGVPARALVRDPAKAAALAALPHVEIALGDMTKPETLAAPLEGVTRAMLISSSVPTMTEVQSTLIDAAKNAGVRHVIKLSGIIPDVKSAFRFGRMHGEIEQFLEKSSLAFTHLRAGEFMHSYFRQVPMILGKGALFLPMEDARIASVDIEDIAAVAAAVLTGSGHEGKIYPLTGPEALTMTEVAVVAGKPVKYINVPPEDAKRAQLAAGVPPYLVDALGELFAERRKGGESHVWPTIAAVFNMKPTSFDQFAAKHAAIFRGEQPASRL